MLAVVVRSHDFDNGQVERAIGYIAEHGAKDRANTVRYSAVFEAVGLPAPQLLHQGGESELVTQFMAAVHWRCIEDHLPPLDALVVHVEGPRKGLPGGGYFTVNQKPDPRSERASPEDMMIGIAFWEDQRKECEQWGRSYRRGQVSLPFRT